MTGTAGHRSTGAHPALRVLFVCTANISRSPYAELRARQALAGFGRAIDAQFRAWQLTPAEREVALLLLKGYSHKAIARHTDRSDATVRQHATAIYQKAGLSGRAELAAYFLEGIPLPDGPAPSDIARA